MSEEYNEGDWVLWECRNGVEIAARRTGNDGVDEATWMCGNWLWYAGGRHTVAGIDHPFDLVRPICRLVGGTEEQNGRLQRDLRETHDDLGEAQRLLDEEREKSARYAGELHDLDVRWRSRELVLFQVIEMLVARR